MFLDYQFKITLVSGETHYYMKRFAEELTDSEIQEVMHTILPLYTDGKNIILDNVFKTTSTPLVIPYKVKQGDVVIRKEKHSCDVRFVEAKDYTGILLVNGIKDRFYEPHELDIFYERYELLVKKEDRLDSYI